MESNFKFLFVVGLVFVAMALLSLMVYWIVKSYNDSIHRSYAEMSERDLILFINDQPDKIVEKKMIAEHFGLSVTVAGRRLAHLYQNGVLTVLYSKMMTKYYYTLPREIKEDYGVKLSSEPFMTLEDLLAIFEHYDYQVTTLELCLVTDLPLSVVKREMKYFEKEGIVKVLLQNQGQYVYQRRYTLNEPYRSQPEHFMKLRDVNHKLEEIYRDTNGEGYV